MCVCVCAGLVLEGCKVTGKKFFFYEEGAKVKEGEFLLLYY